MCMSCTNQQTKILRWVFLILCSCKWSLARYRLHTNSKSIWDFRWQYEIQFNIHLFCDRTSNTILIGFSIRNRIWSWWNLNSIQFDLLSDWRLPGRREEINDYRTDHKPWLLSIILKILRVYCESAHSTMPRARSMHLFHYNQFYKR